MNVLAGDPGRHEISGGPGRHMNGIGMRTLFSPLVGSDGLESRVGRPKRRSVISSRREWCRISAISGTEKWAFR